MDFPENLRARSLIETNTLGDVTDRLELAGRTERRKLPGQNRLTPRGRHEALGGEVVHFIQTDFGGNARNQTLVEKISGNELDLCDEMFDALVHVGARASRHSDDSVFLTKQKLSKIRAILSGDPRNERRIHGMSISDLTEDQPAVLEECDVT